jgi:hypothetical protein
MRKSILIIGIIAISVTVAIIACNSKATDDDHTVPELTKEQKIKRGEYLVTIGGCDDCHSPKIMGAKGPEIDMEHRLSGYPANRPFPAFDSAVVKKGMVLFNEDLTAAAGPWGVSFAANLTSDATGAGSWPEENFIRAIRKGKFKGLENSRELLPPMPWYNFAVLTDEDLTSIFAFLQSTKPIENVVPATRQIAELK